MTVFFQMSGPKKLLMPSITCSKYMIWKDCRLLSTEMRILELQVSRDNAIKHSFDPHDHDEDPADDLDFVLCVVWMCIEVTCWSLPSVLNMSNLSI